jgi:hypothetical protein
MRLSSSIMSTVATVALATAPASAGTSAPALDAVLVNASATSTLAPSGRNSYEAWHPLASQSTTRFWCEGKPDEGVGEALVIDFVRPTRVAKVEIRGGVWKSPALFKANNIVTAIDAITDDGRTQQAALPETMDAATVAIGGAPIKSLRLRIAKVKKGRMNDSCISDVDLEIDGKPSLVIGVDAAQADALPATMASLWHAVSDCDAAAAKDGLRFPFVYSATSGDAMKDTKYKDAAAFVRACKKGAFSSFHEIKVDEKRIVTQGPGKIAFQDDTLEWDLVLDHGRWKLTALIDGTP